MLDLSNIFNKDLKKAIISKEKLAEMLRVTPEALKAFEKSYQLHSMNEPISDNLFKVNAKQAASLNPKQDVPEKGKVQDLIDRIVNELLDQALIYEYDGKPGFTYGNIYSCNQTRTVKVPENSEVTLEEINELPKELRPDLTGRYVKKNLSDGTGDALLEQYQQYLNTKDPRKKRFLYDHFRQGLDMLDLDGISYAILDRCQNSIGNWFPRLVNAIFYSDFFQLPKTKIMKVPLPVLQMSRMEYTELSSTTFQIIDQFCQKAFELDETKEYFIKTGVFSSKFDFRNAHIHDAKEVKEIGEYLLFISFQASCFAHYDLSGRNQPSIYGAATTNEWVVREFIKDKENNPCIYKGLPLHTEYRVFIDADTKEVLGINPYWDPDVMKKRFGKEADANNPDMMHDYVIYAAHEKTLMERYEKNKEKVQREIMKLLPFLDLRGQWSIDVMQNGEDFWIIDMALAKDSALLSCVPKDKIKAVEEDWIPRISIKEL